MRVTIVVDDNIVLVDGKPAHVDLSPLIADRIHAVQWYDSKGEVEFRADDDDPLGDRQPNERISDFTPFNRYVEKWKVQREADERLAREMQERMEEIGRQSKV
jgi:hypothetical protein